MRNVVKTNFTLPRELKAKLESVVEPRKASAFVSLAIREKIEQIEQEKLRQELVEGYTATKAERMKEVELWQAEALKTWNE